MSLTKSQLWHLPADICSMPKRSWPRAWLFSIVGGMIRQIILAPASSMVVVEETITTSNPKPCARVPVPQRVSPRGPSHPCQGHSERKSVLLGHSRICLDRPGEDQELTSSDQQVRMSLAEGGTMACWETEVGRGCGCGSKLASISRRGCRHGEVSGITSERSQDIQPSAGQSGPINPSRPSISPHDSLPATHSQPHPIQSFPGKPASFPSLCEKMYKHNFKISLEKKLSPRSSAGLSSVLNRL